MKIIFVCRGNMFRSQLAEAFFNQLKEDDSIAYSYGAAVQAEGREGIKLSTYPELEASINEMKKYNLDISNNVCKQLKPGHIEGVDKVIVMAEEEYIPDWLIEHGYEKWDIPNPTFVTPEIAKTTANDIRKRVLELVENK